MLEKPMFGLPAPLDKELVRRVLELEHGWTEAVRSGDRLAQRRLASEAEALASRGRRNAVIVMPAEILSEMQTVDALVSQLGRDIAQAGVPSSFAEGWRSFAAEWSTFFAEHQSWWSRTWAAVYEKTVEYRRRVASWRSELERLGGRTTGPKDTPPAASSPLPDLRTVALYGGLALGGLVVVRSLLMGR